MKSSSIAGMSLGGGQKENFFFCLFEYFEKEKRWFLTSLKQVRDEEKLDRDEVITNWINNYSLKRLVVDFPLTKPLCETCSLDCPGVKHCHHPVINNINRILNDLLDIDTKMRDENPKRYEQEREVSNQVSKRAVITKGSCDHMLSKSFKRRIKKGFIPYWNRPVDLWVWQYYYDEILNYFNTSYDSFGNISLMLMNRFHYLLRHFPSDLNLYESNTYIILIELLKAKVIAKRDIDNLKDLETSAITRVKIAKAIEKKLDLFIYTKDLELIAKNIKAFESFLLAVSGYCLVLKQTRQVDKYGQKESANLIAPIFS
ncbi:MAG: hypothetical protein N4A33_04135 [Bacteriovoracaceae bacterium]|jgi:hypothetical protein|nr:hypothetical protein [Bacteriovoracaceae bacterium]